MIEPPATAWTALFKWGPSLAPKTLSSSEAVSTTRSGSGCTSCAHTSSQPFDGWPVRSNGRVPGSPSAASASQAATRTIRATGGGPNSWNQTGDQAAGLRPLWSLGPYCRPHRDNMLGSLARSAGLSGADHAQ
jgi:hypothetical protein